MAYSRKGGKHQVNQKDDELEEILNELWELDENKCFHGREFSIDLQAYASTKQQRDKSRDPLFSYFNEDEVFQRETFRTFKDLLDNYTMQCGEAEEVTPEEKKENRAFIEACMRTKVMKRAREWLMEKNLLSSGNFTPDDDIPGEFDYNFMRMLYRMWFNLYRRTRGDRDFDSSSFEHVFVGEAKEGKILGLHNWVQFYLKEKEGEIDYYGFFGFKTDREDSSFRLLTLQFKMTDDEDNDGDADVEGIKNMGSIFLGTSPEFELAAFTIMKLKNSFGKTPCQLGEYEVMLECFPFGQEGIGTAFIGCQ